MSRWTASRLTLDLADTSTWVRKNGKWACALHSEAIAGDPFGRDKAKKAVNHPFLRSSSTFSPA